MKQVIFHQTGLPSEVLQLEEAPMPQPKPHEVRIKVTARNINPSDIMFVRGMYGITPKLPSSAGFEGAGVVDASDESNSIPVGTRVIFTAIGTWKEYVCIPAALVIPTPQGMTDEVACQAFVNPMTAYGMIEEAGLQAGQWLLITAGASAFGKFAIQICIPVKVNTDSICINIFSSRGSTRSRCSKQCARPQLTRREHSSR